MENIKVVYVVKRYDNDENFGIYTTYDNASYLKDRYSGIPELIIVEVELDTETSF